MPRHSYLRVISGSAKGLRLSLVPGKGTRPIRDRVKEALFNILGAEVEGATFLDLFAGTGSVGIEALSRGAEQAVFIDLNPRALNTIKSNLDWTQLNARATIKHEDAFHFLGGPRQDRFDYIYVAPPQYKGIWEEIVMLLDQRADWLNPDGWVIAQIDTKEYRKLPLEALVEFDQRRYGTTCLVFYELPGE